MKFKKYINELENSFYKYIDNDFSEAGEQFQKGNILYRGTGALSSGNGKKFTLIEPKNGRVSKDGLNLYNPIINEHPSGKEFPKRNVICTTNSLDAHFYGPVFVILPKNNSKIAICKREDIGHSFSKFSKGKGPTFIEFQRAFGCIYDPKYQIKVGSLKYVTGNPRKLSDVKKICNGVERKIKTYKFDSRSFKGIDPQKPGNFFDDQNKKILNAFFDLSFKKSLFDQMISNFENSDFKVSNINSLDSIYADLKEVGFDAPYLLIEEQFLKDEGFLK